MPKMSRVVEILVRKQHTPKMGMASLTLGNISVTMRLKTVSDKSTVTPERGKTWSKKVSVVFLPPKNGFPENGCS